MKIDKDILEIAREFIDGLTVSEPSLDKLLEINARLGRELEKLRADEAAEVPASPDREIVEGVQPPQELPHEDKPAQEEPMQEEPVQEIVTEAQASRPASLRKYFSINDYFYYGRELYGGNRKEFQHLLDRLSALGSLEEATQALAVVEKINIQDGPGKELFDRIAATRFFS